MLIDRKKATNSFQSIISSQNDWIYVIGQSGTGKTYFIKSLTHNERTVYCEPNHRLEYWKEFLAQIQSNISEILLELIKVGIIKLQNDIKYAKLSEQEKIDILENAVIDEITLQKAVISKLLGKYFSAKYNYIVLDNFYKCDIKSYNWLTSLLDSFSKNSQCHIVVICDTDMTWYSEELKVDLFSRFTRIEIDKYDDSKAYFDLINSVVHFDNSEILIEISKKLYKNFNANAHSILSLINMLKNDDSINRISDREKEKLIIDKSLHLSANFIHNASYILKEILATLAISPISLSAQTLDYVLEHNIERINNELYYCLNNNLIEKTYNSKKNLTEYQLTKYFSTEIYIKQLNETQIRYLYEKIYRAFRENLIDLSIEQSFEIAIKCESEDVNVIASKYFNDIAMDDSDISYKAGLLNKFLSVECTQIPESFYAMKYVDILYNFGYYQNAYKLICNIKNYDSEYEYLMKKGDIEHLILHSNTSSTFEQASNIPGISKSQMLSAINRQIMALTQENKEKLQNARLYYEEVVNRYSEYECDGLIELLRNSNNIFPYQKALQYTIKGYNLAVKLNNDIEKIKTLHNICMLKVLNGNYYSQLNDENLNIEPDFNMICKEFEKNDKFLHELSYPLLDLGTLEMFKFVENTEENIENLYLAKDYFSRAQIYAKSFYAKNIANTSLLIVNSYLHKNNEEYIVNARKRIFDNYSDNAAHIKDFRVHRKILFALATSASITKHFDEGRKYLLMSKLHVFENETLRYNNLCDDLDIPNEKIEYCPPEPEKVREYHTNSKFVPWLISFGH